MKQNLPDIPPTSEEQPQVPSWKSLWGAMAIAIILMLALTGVLTAASRIFFPKYNPEAHAQHVIEQPNASDKEETSTSVESKAAEPEPPFSEPSSPDSSVALEKTPTKLIARYQNVDISSPISIQDLTGVLFHQASYAYGLVMETQLPNADEATVLANNGTRINYEQKDGEWLDADALHLYRYQDSTAIDTSIDVGADPGTIVYAPVSGTVVLVKDYQLYGYIPDIEIHICPDGRDDLDLVVLHTCDPLVKPGDRVEAGRTEVSHVRDISVSMDGIQLDDYDGAEHLGNHAHIQINDANWPDYRNTKLAGAVS